MSNSVWNLLLPFFSLRVQPRLLCNKRHEDQEFWKNISIPFMCFMSNATVQSDDGKIIKNKTLKMTISGHKDLETGLQTIHGVMLN